MAVKQGDASKDTKRPAFPFAGSDGHCLNNSGMTLRDYFAAKATEEDIRANMPFGAGFSDPYDRAAARFRHADAMLRERAK